ncbi:hypothetical protein V6N13_092150 [Hibiscus sabdariffa]|uniref:RNase H type-1 domain-containing protein n=1 Tax=Hibiscus sabdariffa TaxID=183260 RepID=A0ABR2QG06_9ROSI
MKFSVACLVSSDHSAGGAVLIANGGVYRALFSGPVTQSNCTLAVLLVVRVVLEIFIEVGFDESFRLEVEIGSAQVLNWLSNPLQRPWSLWKTFAEIDLLACKLWKSGTPYLV